MNDTFSTSQSNRRTGSKLAFVVAIIVAASALAWWLLGRSTPITPVEAPIAEIAKFVGTRTYRHLPASDQLPYMKRFRKESAALRTAYESKLLSEQEYELARLNGWMARQIDHMDAYYSNPESTRTKILFAEYAAAPATKPSATSAFEPDNDVKDAFIRSITSKWTPEEQAKWEKFRADTKAAKSAAKSK